MRHARRIPFRRSPLRRRLAGLNGALLVALLGAAAWGRATEPPAPEAAFDWAIVGAREGPPGHWVGVDPEALGPGDRVAVHLWLRRPGRPTLAVDTGRGEAEVWPPPGSVPDLLAAGDHLRLPGRTGWFTLGPRPARLRVQVAAASGDPGGSQRGPSSVEVPLPDGARVRVLLRTVQGTPVAEAEVVLGG